MNYLSKFLVTLALLVGLLGGAFLFPKTVLVPQESGNSGGSFAPVYITNFTASSVTVTSTRKLILDSAKGGRQFARICLDGTVANLPVYLFFTQASTTVATSSGLPIVSMGQTNGENCYEMTADAGNLWQGQVWGITNTSTAQTVTTLTN